MSDAPADPPLDPARQRSEPDPFAFLGEDGPGPGSAAACWRCGKGVEPSWLTCRHCRAALRPGTGPARPRRRQPGMAAPVKLALLFTGLLVTSLVYGWAIDFDLVSGDLSERDRLAWMVGAEAVDTALVVAALLWIGRPPPLPRPSARVRWAGWLAAVPALPVLLVLNGGYHYVLRQVLGLPLADEGSNEPGRSPAVAGLALFAECVQPAVVEELFCRYLALGVLRPFAGTHGAVVVSAVLFALAHVFSPFSMPVFFVIGITLGYLRVASRSLGPPVLVHFAHNAVIGLGLLP